MDSVGSRPALVIAAHGSRSESWRQRIGELAEHVRDSAGAGAVFERVDVAYLEAAEPRIPDAVRELLASGYRPIVVAPLFLTASTHLGEDVPGVLGQPVPEHVTRRLVGEGQRPLVAGLPVILLDLGPLDGILMANVRRRLSLQCEPSGADAVVLCAYGSTIHHARWEALLASLAEGLIQAGFGAAGWAYVGHVVGSSPEPTVEAIRSAGAADRVRRVHVVSLLVSTGALQDGVIQPAVDEVVSEAPGYRVMYTGDSILPDGDLAARIAGGALQAIGVFHSGDRGVLA